MALGIALTPINIKDTGGFRFRIVKFTGDTDIPAAGTGYTVTAASLNLNGIKAGFMGGDETGVYYGTFTPAASGASAQYRWFNADDAVEAAVGEDGVLNKVMWAFVIGW